jgi:hypothetical protein
MFNWLYPHKEIPIEYIYPNGARKIIGWIATANIDLLKRDADDNIELVGHGLDMETYGEK